MDVIYAWVFGIRCSLRYNAQNTFARPCRGFNHLDVLRPADRYWCDQHREDDSIAQWQKVEDFREVIRGGVCDGLFDCVVWTGYGLTDFIIKSKGVYSGAHVTWKGTRTLRAKKIVAESDEKVLIDCDGEQPGTLPCTMIILPAAIRLKV